MKCIGKGIWNRKEGFKIEQDEHIDEVCKLFEQIALLEEFSEKLFPYGINRSPIECLGGPIHELSQGLESIKVKYAR